MNTPATIAFMFFCAAATGFSEPSEKEIIALMNKVEERVAGGDVSALNDLTALPGEWAVPAFLTIFRENYNISGATPTNRAIGEKAALLATSVPGGEAYFVTLLNAKGGSRDNSLSPQQIAAVKALICVHNKTSVRILGGALDSPAAAGRAANALATMGLPGAPYSSKDKAGTSDANGIARWKEWWKSNAANYSGSN